MLRINKWIHELDLHKRSLADLCLDENRVSVIVPLAAFIAYFQKVISLYQHQAGNCRVLVLGPW